MTPQQIAADVDRLIEIKTQIASLSVEAKMIEKRLELAGLEGKQVPLQDTQREGRQFIARGTTKAIPVRFESDQLVSAIRPDSDLHKELLTLLGTKFADFFKDTRTFERKFKDDANKFRKFARENLAPDVFAKLISMCLSKDKSGIPKSKTVIAWDEAKPLDQVPAA